MSDRNQGAHPMTTPSQTPETARKRIGRWLDAWSPWRLRDRLHAETVRADVAARKLDDSENERVALRARVNRLRSDLDKRLEMDARTANPDAVTFHAAQPSVSRVSVPIVEPRAQVWVAQGPTFREGLKTRTAEIREWHISMRLGALEIAEWGRPEIAAAVRRWLTNEVENIAIQIARSTQEAP